MKLKHYEFICLIVCLFLGYEYALFNGHFEGQSLIQKISFLINPKVKLNLSPTPGYPLSYFLGWLGFGIMCVTNFYILRKRFHFMKGLGKLSGWLEFHIFCGMLGPILIIFHSNFKVEGLVSISFWSMIISSTSGIVGRYFYIQTLRKKEDLKKRITSLKNQFITKYRDRFSDEKFEEIFIYTYEATGIKEDIKNPVLIFISCLRADVDLMFTDLGKKYQLNKSDGNFLKTIGLENRRASLYGPFNQLLGYWHSFHLPFAFFMYLVAIIHIVAALLFGVKH
jgi:hypothetical protein